MVYDDMKYIVMSDSKKIIYFRTQQNIILYYQKEVF